MVTNLGFSYVGKPKERRKTARRKVGAIGWIRLDGGIAVRQCNVVNLSDDGAQMTLEAAEKLPNTFTFLSSRNAGSGRRARVVWRRGSQIGAKFD